ncbi:MAG TPA: hypothetical protein VFW45_08680 [Candidatus Polarisedimenticolia bacterium]|nr:hypothetical protein [Candidatus Polarisedimenticolia bacterium]
MRKLLGNERGISLPGGMLAAAGVATILAGSFVLSQGMIRVSVDEHRDGGDHIHLMVPGAIVPAALAFIPAREIGRHMPLEAKRHLPVVEAALQEISRLPDCTLVEVEGRDEHVRIRIEDGRVVIDVNDRGDEVHVTMPLSTARSVLRKIQSAAEYATGDPDGSGGWGCTHVHEGGHHEVDCHDSEGADDKETDDGDAATL